MARILGGDPGFANMGLVGMEFDTDINDSRIVYSDLIRTERQVKKLRIRLEDDNRRRHGILYEKYKEALAAVEPDMVSLEAVSHVRNSAHMCQIGGSWYGFYYMLLSRGIWLTTYTPVELKQRAIGKKSATKETMIAAVERRWPKQIDWTRWPDGKHEHVADAAVAAWAAITDPQVPWSILIKKTKSST